MAQTSQGPENRNDVLFPCHLFQPVSNELTCKGGQASPTLHSRWSGLIQYWDPVLTRPGVSPKGPCTILAGRQGKVHQ